MQSTGMSMIMVLGAVIVVVVAVVALVIFWKGDK